MGLKKYFIAIVLPEPLQEKTEAIKQDLLLRYGLRSSLRSPSHITLHRPFEWKEEKETVLAERLRAFKFEEAFDLELCDFNFFAPRVIYVAVKKNEPLFQLYTQLKYFCAREFKLLNEVEDERGFHPHVTVAFRDLKKPVFYELEKEFAEKKFDGQFSYTGFSLLKFEERWESIYTHSK